MPDETTKNPGNSPGEGHGEKPDGRTRRGDASEPRTGDRLIDGRLDPDAQSPDDEGGKPFDPRENDPA